MLRDAGRVTFIGIWNMITLIKCEECLQLTGFCLSLGSHVNMGRSWLPRVVSKTVWMFRWGRDQIVPGSTFWWIPFFMTYKSYIYIYIYIKHTHTHTHTHIYGISHITQTHNESCMDNLYADVYIKFSQSILNQIWVIDFVCVQMCVPCFIVSRKFVCGWVCLQVLNSYLCAHDSIFVNCPKLTFTSITTNISLTHTGQAKPFQHCPHWSLSLALCHWSLMRLAALGAQ